MTNSVNVFPAGMRLTDADTGAPLEGGVIYFYEAGTTTPRTVYADADLTVPIGTSVTTDSLGYPSFNGGKTLVYTGTAAYKIVIQDAASVTIATHDNIKGAVSEFDATTLSINAVRPVVSRTASGPITTSNPNLQNNIILASPTNTPFTLTLPSAITAGSGWAVTVMHTGTLSQVVIATQSSQTITAGPNLSYGTAMALSFNGEEVTFVSDGGNWNAVNYVSPQIKRSNGVILVENILSTPPASPTNGAMYILGASPQNAWSGYAQHDVVQHTNGGAWVKWTPPSNCGWIAYNKNNNKNYQYRTSAWVDMTALQADMEAATSSTLYVTPAVVKHHPAVPKFWAYVTLSGTTPTLAANYNVTSVTRNSQGFYTLTFTTAFSGTSYAVVGSAEVTDTIVTTVSGQKATGSVQVKIESTGGSAQDRSFQVVGFGDQ